MIINIIALLLPNHLKCGLCILHKSGILEVKDCSLPQSIGGKIEKG